MSVTWQLDVMDAGRCTARQYHWKCSSTPGCRGALEHQADGAGLGALPGDCGMLRGSTHDLRSDRDGAAALAASAG